MLIPILFFAVAFQAPSVGIGDETIVVAKAGELVTLTLPAEDDHRYHWSLIDNFENHSVDGASGTLYIAMPAHDIRVDLIIVPHDIDKRIEIRKFRLQCSTPADEDGEPTPTPEPGPELPTEYDGPNQFGIGQIAWDLKLSAAEMRYTKEILQQAIGHLRGYGGLKYIDSEDVLDDEKNIFKWLRLKLDPSTHPIVDALELLRSRQMTTMDWDNAMDEAIQALSIKVQHEQKKVQSKFSSNRGSAPAKDFKSK